MSQTTDLKNMIHDYGHTLHTLRNDVNNHNDPISKAKASKINQALDDAENRRAQMMLKMKGTSSNTLAEEAKARYLKEYSIAFDKYIRKGIATDLSCSLDQLAADGVCPNDIQQLPKVDSNGFQFTPSMSDLITQRMLAGSVMRQVSNAISISKEVIDLPAYTKHIATLWGDGRTVADVTDSFSRKTIRLFDLTAQPKVMQRMLDDAQVDMEGWLSNILSDVFMCQEDSAFFNGDGITQPKGFLSYPDGNTGDSIQRVANGSATQVTINGLLNLQAALTAQYEKTGDQVFIVSKQALAQIRLLKDANGQYLWTPGMMTNSQNSMFGVAVYSTNELPPLAAGSDAVVYANMKRGYQIVDNINIQIQRDPFSSKPFVIFYALKRVGGDVVDSNAIKVLKMA